MRGDRNFRLYSKLVHVLANVALILVVYNYYMRYEHGNYACSIYTHIFGFVFPVIVVLFLWYSPRYVSMPLNCLKFIVYILAYSMFWFHFMYDLESRGVFTPVAD